MEVSGSSSAAQHDQKGHKMQREKEELRSEIIIHLKQKKKKIRKHREWVVNNDLFGKKPPNKRDLTILIIRRLLILLDGRYFVIHAKVTMIERHFISSRCRSLQSFPRGTRKRDGRCGERTGNILPFSGVCGRRGGGGGNDLMRKVKEKVKQIVCNGETHFVDDNNDDVLVERMRAEVVNRQRRTNDTQG